MKVKVSEWLNELHSHSILGCEAARKDFEDETEETAPWKEGYTREQMQQRIDARGKGGKLADGDDNLIGAIDVAQACYEKFAGGNGASSKFGMGFQFREYVRAIEEAGH